MNPKADPLLNCLTLLGKLSGKSINQDALTTGIALKNGKLDKQSFKVAAKRANFKAKLKSKSLRDIPAIVLPVILNLKDDACLLLSQSDDGECTILTSLGEQKNIRINELNETYSNDCFYIQDVSLLTQYQQQGLLWGLIKQQKNNFIFIAIAALVTNTFALASPLYIMNIYDRVIPNQAYETLWALSMGIVFILIFDIIVKTLRGFLNQISSKKIDIKLSHTLFSKIIDIPIKDRPYPINKLTNQLQGFEAVRDFFISTAILTISDIPFILLFLVVIAVIAGHLVWVPLGIIPIIIITAIILEKAISQQNQETFKLSSQKQALAIESIYHLETIKTFNTQHRQQSLWENISGHIIDKANQSQSYSQFLSHFIQAMMQLNTVGLVVLGVILIHQGTLSMGGLIAAIALSSRALAPLNQVANLIMRAHLARMGLKSIQSLLDNQGEHHKGFNQPPVIKGHMQFSDVSFAYPNQSLPALKQLNFTIKEKEKVALLGRMGSGKTSVFKLLMQFYQPSQGSIRLDKIGLKEIAPSTLRKHIGYVSQTDMLFSGSLRDNVLMYRHDVDEAQFNKVMQITGLDLLAEKYDAGFDVNIDENKLSLGQKQAVILARALIDSPPILLLDEPTSHMDSQTEKKIMQSLKRVCQSKTLILITHKMNLLELVDRIIILDEGQIVANDRKDIVLKMLQD